MAQGYRHSFRLTPYLGTYVVPGGGKVVVPHSLGLVGVVVSSELVIVGVVVGVVVDVAVVVVVVVAPVRLADMPESCGDVERGLRGHTRHSR